MFEGSVTISRSIADQRHGGARLGETFGIFSRE